MRKEHYRLNTAHRVGTLFQKLESLRRLKDRKKHQVRMLKKAKEMPRDYTVDAQACHVYHNSPAGKECWCIMDRITNQSIGHTARAWTILACDRGDLGDLYTSNN